MLEFHFNLVNLTIMAHKMLFLNSFMFGYFLFGLQSFLISLEVVKNMPKLNKIVCK